MKKIKNYIIAFLVGLVSIFVFWRNGDNNNNKYKEEKQEAKAEYEIALDDIEEVKTKYNDDLKENKTELNEIENKIKKQQKVNEQTKKEIEKLKEGLDNDEEEVSTDELISNLSNFLDNNSDN